MNKTFLTLNFKAAHVHYVCMEFLHLAGLRLFLSASKEATIVLAFDPVIPEEAPLTSTAFLFTVGSSTEDFYERADEAVKVTRCLCVLHFSTVSSAAGRHICNMFRHLNLYLSDKSPETLTKGFSLINFTVFYKHKFLFLVFSAA